MSKVITSLLVLLAFGWVGSVSALPITGTDTVSVDGHQWAQVDLFTNLTWDEIDAVCRFPSCISGGTLNGYDMTGWRWASPSDMIALFNSYIPSSPMRPSLDTYREADSQWAPAFFADGWRSTSSDAQRTATMGFSNLSNFGPFPTCCSITLLSELTQSHAVGGIDVATNWGGLARTDSTADQYTGAWFFREEAVNNVSSPATTALVSIGLAVLGFGRRKRKLAS